MREGKEVKETQLDPTEHAYLITYSQSAKLKESLEKYKKNIYM